MYIEDRLFSETSNEILYSIKMTEDEYDLFSEFTERLYFQSAATGEYYTSKELLEKAKEIQGEYKNGSRKYNNGDTINRDIPNREAIRKAYIDQNLGVGTPGSKVSVNKGLKYLTEKGLYNRIPNRVGTGHSYQEASDAEIKLRRAWGKSRRKLTRLLKRVK